MSEVIPEQNSQAENTRERVIKLTKICESFGFDAEIQSVPDESKSLAVFLYNDAGSLAETTSVYESLKEKLELNMHDGDQYSFAIEAWQDKFPYLKLIPNK
jgi:hypothetical protein